jgi:hypothetical protein
LGSFHFILITLQRSPILSLYFKRNQYALIPPLLYPAVPSTPRSLSSLRARLYRFPTEEDARLYAYVGKEFLLLQQNAKGVPRAADSRLKKAPQTSASGSSTWTSQEKKGALVGKILLHPEVGCTLNLITDLKLGANQNGLLLKTLRQSNQQTTNPLILRHARAQD